MGISSRFFILGLLLLGLVQVALAQPSGTFPAPKLNLRSFDTPANLVSFLDRRQPNLRATRGILMQSLAEFRLPGGQSVPANQVTLEEPGSASEKINGICLRIGEGACARFLLSDDHVRALAAFVANGRTRALTLPTDARSEEDQESILVLIRDSMSPVDDGIKEDWIARELPATLFAETFRYVDYSDPFPFENPDFERDSAERLRTSINAAVGHGEFRKAEEEDGTWVNADFHANFVAYDHLGSIVCDGLPARYTWTLQEGAQFAYVEEVAFAAPEAQHPQHRWLFQSAQSIFCTTAILRGLHADRPASLALLLD